MAFPTGLVQSKQVHKFLTAPVQLLNLAYPNAASMDVSIGLTTAATTAGDGGTVVPHQAASLTQMGWSLNAPDNRVEIYDAASGDKLTNAATSREVYGRVSAAGPVYTLALFTLVAGVETPYTPPAAVNINAEFHYQYSFEALPTNALVGFTVRNVANDPGAQTRLRQERVTVTGANTLAALSIAYAGTGLFMLTVNGQVLSPLGGGGAAFTAVGTALTWSAANAGFNLGTTDIVEAHYAF